MLCHLSESDELKIGTAFKAQEIMLLPLRERSGKEGGFGSLFCKIHPSPPGSIDVVMCSLGLVLFEVLTQERVYDAERRGYTDDWEVGLL